MRTLYLIVFSALFTSTLLSQPVNDECITAIHLPSTESWCSDPAEFTNVNALPFSGNVPANNCFVQMENEVWFTFIALTPAVYIKVSGAVNNLGTLQNPAVAVFSGNCNNLTRVGCNLGSSTGFDQVELSVDGLSIGAVYHVMVEGTNQSTGTFQICLEGFIPPPIPQSDCNKAVILCDKTPFVVDTILGIGTADTDIGATCVMQELSSVWYKWTCETAGTLTFTLIPNGYQPGFESDDLDFVLFELPGGLNDCDNKRMIRCVAAGEIVGQTFSQWERCNGPTGIRVGESDITEVQGCPGGQNSFVKELNMEVGKSYALMVNNFSQSGLGFSIVWGGTGTFQGPEPAFDITAVEAFECDKTIIFSNESNAPTDSIVSYLWNFGAGATPLFDTTKGPLSVVYESFGEKKVALTVTSSKGCVVTEIIDFFVEPCCADTSTLAVTAITTDQLCPGTATGVIQGVGISGSPEYRYSLDCVNYQPASVFPTLLPGTYTLCIQDQKGCESQVEVEILPSTNFWVEAGDTMFVQLGNTVQLNAITFPALPAGVSWTNNGTLTFNGTDIQSQLSPIAKPKTTGWYVITITDDMGCIAFDSVLIVVDPYKPIYIPNVFSPNLDQINDEVTIYGATAATGVDIFQIFDRWGGLMFERTNFMLNDPSLGWDGTCNGKPVVPGVYSYRAVVDFYDDIPVTYHGTITVLK